MVLGTSLALADEHLYPGQAFSAKEQQLIVLIARYTVKPGQSAAVLAALARMAPLVAEYEPGCVSYQVCQAQDSADQLLLYEQYVDEAALLAHRETAHFKELIEGTVVPLLEGREREFYHLRIGVPQAH